MRSDLISNLSHARRHHVPGLSLPFSLASPAREINLCSMIEISKLRKTFGAFIAVDDLSFRVERGEVLGFLGPNGAGKSTTMKMLTGFLRPDAGQVRIGDFDIITHQRAAQKLIGYLPEGAPAWPEMSPRGFLNFIADIRQLQGSEKTYAFDRAVAMTELHAVLDQPIETLSKGYRRRVGLAQAVLHDPPVLVMDEPTDGLDPNQKYGVRQAISEMAAEKAIIISTHILEEVDAICSRAIVIDHGRMVGSGTPAQLAGQSIYAGAVSITVPSALRESVARELENWSDVAQVDVVDRDSEVSITVFPADADADLLQRIKAQSSWQMRSIALEQGRLDDVFRRLTRRAS